jgi:hypothetical protein
LHWSFDGAFWHPAPAEFDVRIEAVPSLKISGVVLDEITKLVASGGTGPLQHDVFREAWDQRYTNPRSAIFIGLAAAELAIKRCISTLVPGAEWLATNLPTPPLERMLKEYLPLPPARRVIDGKVVAPPAIVLASLKKGVTIRNNLAHAGGFTPSLDTVDEVLDAVRDVLWLLDYYCGSDWALQFVRPDTRKEPGSA